MRIVCVGTAYPLRGGIAHYIALLVDILRKRGHRVHVLSFSRQYPSFLFPGRTQVDNGVELIPVGSAALLDSIQPFSWVRALFWLRKVKPDIVVFKYWMPFFAPCYAFLSFFIRAIFRVPVVFICDNIVPHEKTPGGRFLTSLVLRFVDGFIVQSGSVREDLLAFRPLARFREVPHPVYSIFPSPLSKSEARRLVGIDEDRILLYFGYIRTYKGLRILVEAMPGIRKSTGAHLVICGEFYEGRDEILGRIRDLGLEGDITVVDRFIPNQDVGNYFCACDLVVLPYISATQSGIVQIAYHYDRPVVVTSVGGLPEVVQDGRTGYVIPPSDPEALARAVERFYKENRESDFVRAVRIEKQKYSWERMAEAVESFARPGSRSEIGRV